MKRTININLSGIIITIDEDAAELLNNYLEKVKQYYKGKEYGDEIVLDIEYRIAEILAEKNQNKASIDKTDVEALIHQLGSPEEFDMDNESGQEEQFYTDTETTKRLMRDPDDKIFCGVCSGLGHYFGIDPFWFRLIWAIAFLFYGSGLLLYILLCIIIPEAKTTADKLQMRGQPVNFENIKKTAEKEFYAAKNNFSKISSSFAKSSSTNKVIRFIDNLIHFIVDVIKLMFKALSKVVAFFLLFVSSVILIALIAALFGEVDVNINESTLHNIQLLDFIFNNTFDKWLFSSGIAILAGIPLFLLILAAIKIIFNSKFNFSKISLISIIIWIIGFLVTGYETLKTIDDFDEEIYTEKLFPLPEISSDTMVIKPNKPFEDNDFNILIENNELYISPVEVEIYPAQDTLVSILLEKQARGDNKKDATAYAENINYNFSFDKNNLILSPEMSFSLENKYRFQNLKVKIYIPEGKTFFIAPEMDGLIDENKHADKYLLTKDDYLFNHYLIFKQGRLYCSDCQ